MLKWLAFVFLCCLPCQAFPAAKSKARWWDENWEYRLSLTVRNPSATALKNAPLIVTGEHLMNQAGLTSERISVLSLRIIDAADKELPIQVDEKDNTGLFLAAGNGILDKDDEIVFQVSLKPKEQRTFLLYFRKKLAPRPVYPSDLKFEKNAFGDRGANYNAVLANGIIEVGVRGDGSEKGPDGKPALGGCGKAAITSLKLNDENLIHLGSLAWFLGNSALGEMGAPAIPWKNPELVINGPVRIIAACRAEKVDQDFGNDGPLGGRFKGDIIRYFMLYAGSPLCQMNETYRIDQADPKFHCLYNFYWLPTHPREWDSDQMFVPLGDQAAVVKFQDERNFNTEQASEGWLAVVNPPAQRGLAVFFNPARARGLFADFYPLGSKRRDVMVEGWGRTHLAAQLRFSYIHDDFNLKPVQENIFGFYAVTSETAADIQAIHRLVWDGGLLKAIEFGFPEEK